MPVSPSHRRESPPPHRLVAMGSAAAITAITVAGAWGFGPAGSSPAAEPEPAAPAGTAATTTEPTTPYGDDGWLTVEDPPTSSPNDDADEGDDSAARDDSAGDDSADSTALPSGSGHGRRVVYDISAQRVWLVDGRGHVERTYPVSGPRDESKLDPGTYDVYSRSRDAVSFNHKETMNYMVRFASGDSSPIGFHDVPAFHDGSLVQTRAQLGTPLSAGCVRQWITDARALWRFAPVGTDVVVTA